MNGGEERILARLDELAEMLMRQSAMERPKVRELRIKRKLRQWFRYRIARWLIGSGQWTVRIVHQSMGDIVVLRDVENGVEQGSFMIHPLMTDEWLVI